MRSVALFLANQQHHKGPCATKSAFKMWQEILYAHTYAMLPGVALDHLQDCSECSSALVFTMKMERLPPHVEYAWSMFQGIVNENENIQMVLGA
jgi:hypothetical protein